MSKKPARKAPAAKPPGQKKVARKKAAGAARPKNSRPKRTQAKGGQAKGGQAKTPPARAPSPASGQSAGGHTQVAYTRRQRETWPAAFQSDLSVHAPQKVYSARKLDAGEHVQIGVTFKTAEDIALWRAALDAHPDETKVAVVRMALQALLDRKTSRR